MKYSLSFLLSFLAIYSFAQPAEIRKVQSAITTGFVLKDTNSLQNFVEDSFVIVHSDGSKNNKSQFIHSYDKFGPDDALSIMLMHDSHTESTERVVVKGVRLSQWLEGDELVRSKVPYTDTYQKVKNRWMLISSEVNDSGEPYYALGDSTGIRSQIAEKYRILEKSFRLKDADLHFSIKTKDFSMADQNGSPAPSLKVKNQMKALFNALRDKPEMINVIEKLEIAEDTVKVNVLQTFNRKQMVDGTVKKIESVVKQRTSWMRTKEGFKLVYIDSMQPVSTTIDGVSQKPEAPLAPGRVKSE